MRSAALLIWLTLGCGPILGGLAGFGRGGSLWPPSTDESRVPSQPGHDPRLDTRNSVDQMRESRTREPQQDVGARHALPLRNTTSQSRLALARYLFRYRRQPWDEPPPSVP